MWRATARAPDGGPQVAWRIGVDIGGTFTDFALLEEASGRVFVHKRLTTPADPAEAVLAGIPMVLAEAGAKATDVGAIVHGTTLVTNAVIERKGALTGMLVTAGFKDVLEIGRELRYDMFDLTQRFPEPLVPRACRAEIGERMRYDGTVATPLDAAEVRAAVLHLVQHERIEALAVCLLHAYANPAHEQAIAALVAAEFPALPVSTSADVWPEMREFERWTTTTVNAYTRPLFDRYLARLEAGLGEIGCAGRLYIMTSSGGVVLPEVARRYPVRLLESGPAAGALMAATLGKRLGVGDLLAFDMGGTTAKGCIIRGHQPLRRYEIEVARLHEFKRGSGLSLKLPVIDMIEIGAGGGGIARSDALGRLRVGPESAGADPGPACYGRGGTRPTLTDANLILGLYDGTRFLGGRMHLDAAAAAAAIHEHVARPLGLTPARAAAGIHEVINEDVARAFRVHAAERGVDYRACTMVAFGGSGPAHAVRIARKLGIPRVVLARGAGVFSALGLLASPLAFAVARSRQLALAGIEEGWWLAHMAPLIAEAAAPLRAAGVAEAEITLRCHLDIRYVGQGHAVEVPVPAHGTGQGGAALRARFEVRYAELYGEPLAGTPATITGLKVEAIGPDPLGGRPFQIVAGDAPTRRPARRLADVDGRGARDCAVYDRRALAPGAVVAGPALIEEAESTCVIGACDRARIDADGNLVVELAAAAEAAA
ncbi:MAG: hydantoinase/oxoprolinase family protein [Alphaproteobacteria bacterium]|nr:hydantoinase/oxoprolinase family protein [Alphaproteobacteria bacterium]